MEIPRHRTAIRRNTLSRPLRLALEAGLVGKDVSVFDYGCGHGDDLKTLAVLGIQCEGWDPVLRPSALVSSADVVNVGYVINVIESPTERRQVVQRAWTMTRKVLIVAARLDIEAATSNGLPYSDGFITKHGTYQKFYRQDELRDWLAEVTGAAPIPAGPGVFFMFRDEHCCQSYLAKRNRRKLNRPLPYTESPLFDQYEQTLRPLLDFYIERGRLPDPAELSTYSQISHAVGSIRRAFASIVRASQSGSWENIRRQRIDELTLHLALQTFSGRPKFADMPAELQLDVRDFFGSYARACGAADRLLRSAGDSMAVDQACQIAGVGKLTHDALYAHESALYRLPITLRAYEGCAREYIGEVEGANLVKLCRKHPRISYLFYPNFDDDPHPRLAGALVVDLRLLRVTYRSFGKTSNVPILHRKETFVAEDYPARREFAELTRTEEELGLLKESHRIGWSNHWEGLLKSKGLEIRGHQIVTRT